MVNDWSRYPDAGLDEMVAHGAARSPTGAPVQHLLELTPDDVAALASARDRMQTDHDMHFALDGKEQRLFPLDLLPRVVLSSQWRTLCAGLEQRARALNALIVDVAGPGDAVRAGVIPAAVLRVPAELGAFRGVAPATVAGMDLLREADGTWRVLEDNLRVPSGLGYAIMARRVTAAVLPERAAAQALRDPQTASDVLLAALRGSAPERCTGEPRIGLLSSGPADSASAEHRLLAARMGVPLLTPGELSVGGGRVSYGGGLLDVLYRRIDDAELAAATLADGRPAAPALNAATGAGYLRVCNALGCGVADDKAVYAFVPRLIEFYLGERPRLADVPTFVLADDEHRAHALDRLAELVVKPVDGYGGRGVTFADRLTATELDRLRATLLADPGGWIAQEPIAASTVPTLHDGAWRPCSVDLRAFVVSGVDTVSGADTVTTLPAPLTRVAAHGSRIVNSSAGGGCKDTWIVAD